MKIKLFSDSDPRPWGRRLSGNRTFPPHLKIRQAIRKQVVAEYESELEGSTGWRRHWVNWKINMVIEIRYKQILFSGGYRRVIH